MDTRVKGVYGTPWSKLAKGITVDRKTLMKLGACLVEDIAAEAKKDFAKRGWSGKAPHATKDKVFPGGPPANGGPPIWDSFSYQISGKSTLEITSTFWGLSEMTSEEGIPGRQMTWLTQSRKDHHPTEFALTDEEKKLKMKKSGRLSKGKRLPLVVPVKSKAGTVIFRTAPLKIGQAWVHPGIARFTFMERAIKKGRQLCAEILGTAFRDALLNGDPMS